MSIDDVLAFMGNSLLTIFSAHLLQEMLCLPDFHTHPTLGILQFTRFSHSTPFPTFLGLDLMISIRYKLFSLYHIFLPHLFIDKLSFLSFFFSFFKFVAQTQLLCISQQVIPILLSKDFQADCVCTFPVVSFYNIPNLPAALTLTLTLIIHLWILFFLWIKGVWSPTHFSIFALSKSSYSNLKNVGTWN